MNTINKDTKFPFLGLYECNGWQQLPSFNCLLQISLVQDPVCQDKYTCVERKQLKASKFLSLTH